jgi:TPR repeat protein
VGAIPERVSVEQIDTEAQINLGLKYYDGKEVSRDYVRAHMWLSLTAENDDEYGVEMRDMAATQITDVQIAEAQKLARECVRKNCKGC